MNFQDVNVIGKPFSRGGEQVGSGGFTEILQNRSVKAGIPPVGLVHGQDIRFTAKPADALGPTDEPGYALGLHAVQFLLGGALL
jgi:hypothetical protein